LPLGAALAKRVPDVQFVLDHCGVPNIAGGELDPWRAAIREIAALPNVACKVSGLVAYCAPGNVTAAAIRPYVEHAVACFGWDRVLFGGDWPVCNLTASLGSWVAMAKELLAGESMERQAKFFEGNAVRIYRVEA
jgi:predicted TIM-barrel fold metal-dependent hydrolase